MKFISENSRIKGNVVIGDDVSIYYGTVVRTESEDIIIGKGSNIQDNCVVHTDPGFKVEIGEYVTVGHGAILHGCKVGDNSIIGMGSIILNGAKVGKNCMIGAGSLISEGKEIPDNSLAYGNPIKIVRELNIDEQKMLKTSALHYIKSISFHQK